MIPFILHWPSLFFSKVSNSRKKVLITPGLYFPNYCITYLPCDISHDFKKCKHVNLRWELTRAVFEELYYAGNNQKIAVKKKVDYREGLEKSRADSAAQSRESWQCSTKLWKLTAQHEAVKVTWRIRKKCPDSAAWSRKIYNSARKTWRRVAKTKLAWLYPKKVRKQLQTHRRKNRGAGWATAPPIMY